MRGPNPKPVALSRDQLDAVNCLLAKATTPRRVADRCRILKLSHEGLGPTQIAAKLDWKRQSISRLRSRFLEEGLEILHDKPRPGRPRTFSPSAAGGNR